ncbi:MAG: acetylxylan esterase [Verrucomicrobiaceae bacterium]|nr:acetylxylan esterase [Verrucomicrobiaceae bacterium]
MKLILPAFLTLAAGACLAQQNTANYDESKAGEVILPAVLKSLDGAKITSSDEWTSKRRPEVLSLFQDHVYGRIQPKPDDLKFEVTATRRDALGGTATRKFIHVSLAKHPQWRGMDIMLYVPNKAQGKAAPVFAGLSFNGNHAVSKETDVPVSDRWMRPNTKNDKAVKNNRATEESRGVEASRWPLEMIVGRGFAVATAYYGDIEPDHAEGWKEGVRAALSSDAAGTVWKDGDWGAIGAWAWGLSRILDYLETDKDVDARHCAVIGHSRLGKTSLWAGASDPRFALVISNDSGEGGAALMRRNIGETTEIITRAFPHWFTPKYRSYANNASACPVDQHMLIALMAPRPVYIASASEDNWADQKGEFLSGLNAGPVYALFGKSGIGTESPPEIDHPVGDFVAYHNRTGKHDVLDYDWLQYLKFAARHFGM